MKRKTKNIIMLIILVLTLGGMVCTVCFAKTGENSAMDTQTGGTPPTMGSESGNTPPEKPDGDNSEPPENSDSSSDDSSSDINDSSSVPTPPNMSDSSNDQTPPVDTIGELNSNGIGNGYYVILGLLGLLASINIIYLIMTRFNKKSFKELFKNSDKAVIYTLATILLTATLTVFSSFLMNTLVKTGENSPNAPNQSTQVSYSAATTIDEKKTITSGNYSSEKADENAILVTKDASLSNVTVTKTGDSDGGDATSFYGNNSAILAKDGAVLTLKNIKVTTNATGANGVFSYGGSATTNNSTSDGTTVNISDSTITTSKDNSGGIMTTGGGIMNATNLKITTAGTSSAAIRSDRGGGTVTVNKGTYKTTGKGSPAVYSTADITVKNADLIATASEGVVIEGKNSVTLENVNLTDTNNTLNGRSTTYKNIFLYQSMSGDAASGNSSFTAKNSNIITNKGDTFYITNTSSEIVLENNKITNNDKTGNFLRAKADSWGNSGSNGGTVTLKMTNQSVSGNIVIDNISTLDMTMKKSTYKGTINGDKTAKSIKLTLDKSSKITLTGDSYVTSLDDEDTTYSNIDFNGYKLYVNGKAIN